MKQRPKREDEWCAREEVEVADNHPGRAASVKGQPLCALLRSDFFLFASLLKCVYL